MANWQPVYGSSNIDAIAYNPDKQECYVKFLSGSMYAYEGVGPGMWNEFLHAPSKGKFVAASLKRTHSYRIIDDLPEPETGE